MASRWKLKEAESRKFLPLEEKTMAEAFRENGYSTCFIGKWHLGSEAYYPEHQGFDINIAGNDNGAPPSYFYPYVNKSWEGLSWQSELKDLKDGKPGEYLTDRLTDEAMQFIDTAKNKPFLLYLAYYTVHIPLQAKEAYVKKYEEKTANLQMDSADVFAMDKFGSYVRQVQNHPVYAGMVQSMDENIGRLLKKLKEQGIEENTIVVFTSDNGGYSTSNFIRENRILKPDHIPTSTLPLRTGKGWYYEAGIRIPTIIHWPGHATPKELAEPIISTDFYPTLLQMAGLQALPDQHQDGLSLVPLLKNESDNLDRQATYWHYPHYHNYGEKPASAIRKGKYKLIYRYEEDKAELYDLEADLAEKNDLSEQLPDVKEELLEDLRTWLKEAGAEFPEGRKSI